MSIFRNLIFFLSFATVLTHKLFAAHSFEVEKPQALQSVNSLELGFRYQHFISNKTVLVRSMYLNPRSSVEVSFDLIQGFIDCLKVQQNKVKYIFEEYVKLGEQPSNRKKSRKQQYNFADVNLHMLLAIMILEEVKVPQYGDYTISIKDKYFKIKGVQNPVDPLFTQIFLKLDIPGAKEYVRRYLIELTP